MNLANYLSTILRQPVTLIADPDSPFLVHICYHGSRRPVATFPRTNNFYETTAYLHTNYHELFL